MHILNQYFVHKKQGGIYCKSQQKFAKDKKEKNGKSKNKPKKSVETKNENLLVTNPPCRLNWQAAKFPQTPYPLKPEWQPRSVYKKWAINIGLPSMGRGTGPN